jgi:hypothetical protein
MRYRVRANRYARHMNIETTLIGKWIPATGHVCVMSDETTMCAAWSIAPTARSGTGSLSEAASALPARKRKKRRDATRYAAAVRPKRTSA